MSLEVNNFGGLHFKKRKRHHYKKSTIIFSALAGVCYSLSVYLQCLFIGVIDVIIVFSVANMGVLISRVLLSLVFADKSLRCNLLLLYLSEYWQF